MVSLDPATFPIGMSLAFLACFAWLAWAVLNSMRKLRHIYACAMDPPDGWSRARDHFREHAKPLAIQAGIAGFHITNLIYNLIFIAMRAYLACVG